MSIETNKEHFARVEKYAKEVQNLYFDIINQCAAISANFKFEEGIFKLKDYPVLNRKVDDLIDKLNKSLYVTIQSGISQEWDKANENNDVQVERLLKNTDIPIKKYQTRNLKALEAFQNRKIKGLNLSQRVWNYSKQLKTELELALQVGIADGRSAAQLSRDVRKYLKEPDKLFRRVRDEKGVLKFSKAAKAYSPGAGVYRSSYKNAMRLTRTEINTSYREADYQRWQQLDFVVGVEVRRSNHVFDCDVCESLKGKYPKDFKFIGWHPQCRCHAIPILAKKEEFLESIEKGTEIKSENEINKLPSNCKSWIKKNENRIIKSKTLPFFIQDNIKYVDSNVIKERTVSEIIVKAKTAEKAVNSLSNSIAEKFGGYSTTVNFKTHNSIIRKSNLEYNGDINKVWDSVRTTIILPKKNIDKCLEYIQNNSNFIRVKIQNPEKYIGYRGVVTNIKTDVGVIGEIQINTAKMIYAKELPETAKKIIGEKAWNDIKRQTGLQGGLGHKYYEEYRILNKNIPEQAKRMMELEKLSINYYKQFK